MEICSITGTEIKSFNSTCEEWENYLVKKYEPMNKAKEEFRNYDDEDNHVAVFYKENHTKQTLDFVLNQKKKYHGLNRMKMGVWEAIEYLNQLIDESDPDTSCNQIMHCIQSAEACREDGKPEWMILTALIHDLGKILVFYGEPQWTVVGDTFPVGCAYSKKIVKYDYFKYNPDFYNQKLQTQFGIYEPHCGLDNVHLSYGHDEYLYQVCKDYLPKEALYCIRYHSFYAAHRENEYKHLMNEYDEKMMEFVREFNPYDLYTKSHQEPNVDELKNYYIDLINKYFPDKISW